MSIPPGVECVRLKNKEHPLYGSVLLYAQEKRSLRSLEVELVQAPTAENGQIAVCVATATFAPPDGEAQVYTDIGDASPASVGNAMLPHLCRMASTRAKGRALRDGCGITTALYEEMGGEPESVGGGAAPEPAPVRQVARPANGQQQRAASSRGSGKFCQFEGCGVEVGPGELKESWDTFHRIYCRDHREAMRRKIAASPAV